ncbi:MAG: hemolysin family protein [Pyrinomonadaceae bacterium]
MQIELGITVLLLVAMTFLSTVEMAFGQLSDVGLRLLIADDEDPTDRPRSAFLREILDNTPRFRFTLSAAIQILLIAFSVLVTAITFQWFGFRRWMVLAVIAGLTLAGLFKQFIPRLLTLHHPERTFLLLLPIVRPFYHFLVFAADPWFKTFDRLRAEREAQPVMDEEDDDDSASDIEALTDMGQKEGILEEDDSRLIHAIVKLRETRVNEVMAPRTEIAALPITATMCEARDAVIESKYSRLPVYREQIDNIEGIIYVRDLLQSWAEGRENESIESLVRPVFFIPETKLAGDLLAEMQKAHQQLAVVIDEYGGVAGLVTIEDILEEVVGEIEDEDTTQEEIIEIVEADDGYYDVLGSTEIGKIERLFGMEIETDDFTTIAGLVISEVGQVPRPGDHLNFRGLDVEVRQADDRRITLLRLRRAPEEAEAESV